MPNNHDHQTSIREEELHRFSRLASNPPRSHTHVQQVAGCIHVDVRGASGC
jgi:hypothetical protein